MGRTPCCDAATVKKGPWSPEEDELLRNYIHKNGRVVNWVALPPKAGLKRCGKSCRLRWLNYLRPDIKHGGFTDEEDQIILSLYNQIGSRWSIIASKLPGRTDNEIKNHWNTKLKKKIMSNNVRNVMQPQTQLPAATQVATHARPHTFFAGMYSTEEQKGLVNYEFDFAPKYSNLVPKTEPCGKLNMLVSDDVSSVASSSISVENNLNFESDRFLFLDYGNDILFDESYGFEDVPLSNFPNYMADLWVNSEVKAEGFFNNL